MIDGKILGSIIALVILIAIGVQGFCVTSRDKDGKQNGGNNTSGMQGKK